jgi:hypothetical protein
LSRAFLPQGSVQDRSERVRGVRRSVSLTEERAETMAPSAVHSQQRSKVLAGRFRLARLVWWERDA